ncbi:leucyl/phenylalanyl-tRNA--protein transferase [Aliarcobacter cryaerophilus ATCC 43158]|uniref:Leucyl/phenylalanyl-tRNA--protein transferase n=1 Tax=Aliarcobacter cryaerophilus ATCC 43158 TaxID=1032070 RepID=A0AAD0TV41_9BACT|nr:leucyl/phenylalanyl-tRNA--protein transferase [Aliarcobacter cryaerophilus]AYJ80059.1 leucyl, phenylalanyl-tRNA-protein transferase [Aliarcobacter cryaerophilus ATCC 43158]PRM97673.1 leucyl/phenylalanyl-tRNA--protein transferase [Aliarcobacter cryaerophilus]QCZ24284.1 leucyl/phenylalanyl-tRNA--protein transferase [Aliarcobacter cryaerophilus ATCC 43158]
MKLLDKKEKIWLLDDENFNFPKLEQMGGDLVAIGGDFHPQRLLNAYENGLFPWFIDDYNYINWYSPQKRMILYPNDLKVSKSLKKSIKNRGFEIKSNTNFENVIRNCQKVKRKHENDTWIDDNFIQAYNLMHNLEFANSIEVYLEGELVGGLYGLIINNIFCGESMFSLVNDASKVAFFYLCNWAKDNNIKIIDCQVYNKHLESLGAYEISREEYFKILKS